MKTYSAFFVLLLIFSAGCGSPSSKSKNGNKFNAEGLPEWVNDPITTTGNKVIVVGIKTNAASIEEGIESARNDAAKQISQSIISYVSSEFTERLQAVIKDENYSEENFVQSVVENTSQSYIVGMQQADKHVVEKESGDGQTHYDIFTRWTISKSFYEEQVKNARQDIRREWYNNPERAIGTARYFLKEGSYDELISELEPLMSLLPTEAYLLIAQAHEKKGNIERARNLYESVIDRFPRTAEATNAQIRLRMILEDEALKKLDIAKALFQQNKHQEVLEEVSSIINYITKDADRNRAIKLYYESASKQIMKGLKGAVDKLDNKTIALMKFTTVDGKTTKEAELLKQSLLSELTSLPDVRVFTPEVTEVDTEKIFKRDRESLSKIAAKLGCGGFIYARAGQLTSIYLIDNDGALLGSANISSISYDPLSEEVVYTSRDVSLYSAFIAKTDGRWRKINESDTLHSGDEFKIVFKADKDVYIYVLIVDSLGELNLLFPNEQIKSSERVIANNLKTIPPKGQTFFLDNNTGTEQIILIASLEEPHSITDKITLINRESDTTTRRVLVRSLLDDLKYKTKSTGVRESKATYSVDIPGGNVVDINFDKAHGKEMAIRFFNIIHK